MTYRVVATTQAIDDQRAIGARMAEHFPVEAERWIDRLADVIDSLSIFPMRFPAALEVQGMASTLDIRQAAFGDYRLIYRFDSESKTVWILHVRHAARKPFSDSAE